jgi:hypothetical protein
MRAAGPDISRSPTRSTQPRPVSCTRGPAAAGRPHTAQTALLAADSLGTKVGQRELGTYDRMFTLIEGGGGKEET